MTGSEKGRLTCLLHAGMHKTGTTSIQQTLATSDIRTPAGRCAYFRIASPNFSGAFVTLYRPDATKHMSNWLHDRDETQVMTRRQELSQRFDAEFAAATADPASTAVLISAEALSSPKDDGSRLRFRNALQPWCKEIRVLAYVRSPVSFLESHFLQQLKTSRTIDFDLKRLWPRYRARFEPLDQIFGSDHVELALYDPTRFPAGDVVKDFARRFELVTSQTEATVSDRLNRGLSLEAAALIYFLRRSALLTPNSPEVVRSIFALVGAISALGSQRLRFASTLVASLLESETPDLDWLENRLGEPVTDAGTVGGLRGESDLMEIANASRDLFDLLIEVALPAVRGVVLTPVLLKSLLDEGFAG